MTTAHIEFNTRNTLYDVRAYVMLFARRKIDAHVLNNVRTSSEDNTLNLTVCLTDSQSVNSFTYASVTLI